MENLPRMAEPYAINELFHDIFDFGVRYFFFFRLQVPFKIKLIKIKNKFQAFLFGFVLNIK